MDDEVQVVYSADAEPLIAGNDAAAESVQTATDAMTQATETMAAATQEASAAIVEALSETGDAAQALTEASAAVEEAGAQMAESLSQTTESVSALGEAFALFNSESGALGEAFIRTNSTVESTVQVLDELSAAYVQLQQTEAEQVTAINAVREAYARLEASTAPVEADFIAVTEAERREMEATEQLTFAQRNLIEVQQMLGVSAEAGATGENQLTEATEHLSTANHKAVTDIQATSAAVRALEGNAGIRAVEVFIGKTLGLGPAMQAIFPIIGALAFADIIVDMGKKLYEAFDIGGARARQTAKEIHDVTEQLEHSSDSLDVQIDKLEQEKAKLEKVPFNGTKLVLDEAREAADRLQTSLEGVVAKELEVVKAMSASAMQRIFTGGSNTGYEQTMLNEHSKWLGVATDAQGKLNESKSYGASLQTRLNELQGKAAVNAAMQAAAVAHGSAAVLTSYDEEIKAVQTMIGWQRAEQSEIEKTQQKNVLQGQVQTLRDNKAPKEKKEADTSGKAVQQYQEQLNQMQIADGQYHALSTSEEIAFWAAKRSLWNDGTNAYREITAKLAELYKQRAAEEKRANEEVYRSAVGAEEMKLAAVERGSQQAIAIRNEMEALAMAFYGADSRQAEKAAAERIAAEREAADRILEFRARAAQQAAAEEIRAAEESGANQLIVARAYDQLGLVTKRQAMAEEQAITEQTDALRVIAAQKQVDTLTVLALANDKYVRDLDNAYKALEQAQAKSGKDSLNADIQNLQQRMGLYQNFFAQMNQGFRNAFDGWLRGSESFGRGMEKVFQGMARSLVENLAEMGLKWAEHEALKLLLTETGQAAQTLATATGTAERKAINASSALAEANTNAMRAATGAYASTVDIPIVGPVLAPIAAAGAYVAVMGLTALASASGGWGQIPNDQLAMVHKDEMILPSGIAQNVRDMTEGGDENHFHLGGNTYHGGGDMRSMIQKSQRELVKTIKSATRDGKLATA